MDDIIHRAEPWTKGLPWQAFANVSLVATANSSRPFGNLMIAAGRDPIDRKLPDPWGTSREFSSQVHRQSASMILVSPATACRLQEQDNSEALRIGSRCLRAASADRLHSRLPSFQCHCMQGNSPRLTHCDHRLNKRTWNASRRAPNTRRLWQNQSKRKR